MIAIEVVVAAFRKRWAMSLLVVLMAPTSGTLAAAGSDLSVRWARGGHSVSVTGVTFSPDGTLAVSSSGDTTIKVWRTSDGRLLQTLARPDTFGVNSATFSADGAYLVTTGVGGGILWRLSDGALIRSFCCLETGYSAAFSPNGEYLAVGGSASGSEEATLLFRMSDGVLLDTFIVNVFQYVFSVAFTPDSQTLITGSGSVFTGQGAGTIRFWRLADGVEIETLDDHTGRVRAITLSPDGASFVSASEDESLKLWNTSDGKLIRTLAGHTGEVSSAVFSPDGSHILSGSVDATVRIWDAATGSVLDTLIGHSSAVSSVAWPDSGDVVLSGGGSLFSNSADHSVRLWSADDGDPLATFTQFEYSVEAVDISPDGQTMVSADGAGDIRFWNTADGAALGTFNADPFVSAVVFSADGGKVAVGEFDGDITVWDAATGAFIQTLTTTNSFASAIVYSPDGQFVATSAFETPIRLWDAENGNFIRQIGGANGWASSLAFSPDSQFLLTAGGNNAVLWSVADGTLVHSFSGHTQGIRDVAYSPDGLHVATGSVDRTVKLWRTSDGALVQTLSGHDDWVRTVAFSRDGQVLASGSEVHDQTLRFWSVADGTPLGVFNGGTGAGLRSLGFSPDNRLVSFARRDATVVAARNPFGPAPGDADANGVIDLADHAAFSECLNGPAMAPDPPAPAKAYDCQVIFDQDADYDVDLADFAALQVGFGG